MVLNGRVHGRADAVALAVSGHAPPKAAKPLAVHASSKALTDRPSKTSSHRVRAGRPRLPEATSPSGDLRLRMNGPNPRLRSRRTVLPAMSIWWFGRRPREWMFD